MLFVVGKITGYRAVEAMHKTLFGAFDAKDLDGIQRNTRKTYFAYYDEIRRIVPPESRLEYKLGDGWEPLCEFLGKEVPNVPFPRVNDREEHQARVLRNFGGLVWKCVVILKWWIIGSLGAVLAVRILFSMSART